MKPMAFEKPSVAESQERVSVHEYSKTVVEDRLDHYRQQVDSRREMMLSQIRGWETLCANELTLPAHKEAYRRSIAEAKDFIARTDRVLEVFDAVPETKEIIADDAVFRLVYEAHDKEHSPKVLEGLDAYAFESFGTEIQKDDVAIVGDSPDGPFNFNADTRGADAPVMGVLRESRLPVYGCDVSGEMFKERMDQESTTSMLVSAPFVVGLLVAGSVLAKSAVEQLYDAVIDRDKDKEKTTKDALSRRDFLGMAGKLIAGTALFGGGVGAAAERMLSKNETRIDGSAYGTFLKTKQDILTSLGLYEVTVRFRNLVMAQKLHTIAGLMREEVAEGAKPHVGMELGAAHYGIEDSLRLSEPDRLKLMRDIAENSEMVLGSPDDEVAAMNRYKYDPGVWESQRIVDPGISEAFVDYPFRKTARKAD